jgi:hypothetical protein
LARLDGEAGVAAPDARSKPHASEGVTQASVPVIPLAARVASVAPSQGGAPDAPRGRPAASMPVPGLTPPAGQGARPACCHRNRPAFRSARLIALRPLRAPRHGSQRRHTPRRFRSTWPMRIASRRRTQKCPPAVLTSQCARVIAGRDPHPPGGRYRRYSARRAGWVREHGNAAPFRPRWGSPGRAFWLPWKGPSSLRSHRDAWKPCEPPAAPGTALPDPRCPARRFRVRHQRRGPRGSRRFV